MRHAREGNMPGLGLLQVKDCNGIECESPVINRSRSYTPVEYFPWNETMDQEILLRIILETPTPDVDFALQKGRGSSHDVVQNQASDGVDLVFEFPVTIKNDQKMGGPFVQGPPGARFVYINIGQCAGQIESEWSRRLKVPLTGISPQMIKRLLSNEKLRLETRVPGRGRDGSPNCATVKPFAGWVIKDQS